METDYLTLGLAKWSIIARVRALTLCTRPNFNSGCQGPNKRVCRLLNPNGALAHSAAIAIVPAALEKFRLFFRWRRGSLFYPPRAKQFSSFSHWRPTTTGARGAVVAESSLQRYSALISRPPALIITFPPTSLSSFLPPSLWTGQSTKRERERETVVSNLICPLSPIEVPSSARLSVRLSVAHPLVFLNPTFLEAQCKIKGRLFVQEVFDLSNSYVQDDAPSIPSFAI